MVREGMVARQKCSRASFGLHMNDKEDRAQAALYANSNCSALSGQVDQATSVYSISNRSIRLIRIMNGVDNTIVTGQGPATVTLLL